MTDRNLLLITAHPDDECMFFLPALTHFQQLGYNLHLLCLSTGNAHSLGPVRTQELYYACSLLGIPRHKVTVVDDARLQDAMRTSWRREVVAEQVEAAIHRYSANILLTFDSGGVSGHCNHIDTSHGVHYAVQKLKSNDPSRFENLQLYMLVRSFAR